jgi:hypothetical protein
MKRLAVLVLACVATSAGWTTSVHAGDTRHSGRVVAIDPAAGTLRIEEMRAWTGPDTGSVELALRLRSDTSMHAVSRAVVDLAGWPHSFKEQPMTVDALKPGDFVTVTTGERGDVALAVEVVRPES